MGRKKGQKNKKGGNEEKPSPAAAAKQEEKVDVVQSGSGESTSAEPVLKDSTSGKQKHKKGKKGDEKHSDTSEAQKSGDSHSSNSNDQPTTKAKSGRKQEKGETEASLVVSEISNTGSDGKKSSKKGKKQKATKEGEASRQEQKMETETRASEAELPPAKEDQELAEFPSLEFTTQQGRKKRKQRKGQQLLIETPPIQHRQAPPQQSRSTQESPQSIGDIQTEEFPTLDTKSAKTQKKRGGLHITHDSPQSSQSLAGEFKELQIHDGDGSKKEQQLIVAEPAQTENFELTIPHRKTRSGTQGRSIQIETNHLALNFRKLDRAVHYDVAITPNTPKKLFRKIMEEFRRMNYSDRHPAFDGTKNLYSSSELPFGLQINRDVTIYEDEKPKQYKVAVKFANFVDLTPLRKFMTANPNGIHHMVTPQEVIQCLDIVLRSAPALTCLPVGRSYFTPPRDQILSLGSGMEMYYGFYQSAIIGWKPFLNIDVAHKAFPKRQNVIDMILDICELRREDLLKPLYKNQRDDVDHFLRTLKVRYELPGKPGTKREYRVNGLERSATEATFRPDNGTEITVEKYFLKDKNIVLKYPDMPCLWVGNKDRVPHILLPAEFCSVIEGQVVNRKMSEKLTSAMIKQAATSTKVRKEKIMGSVRKARFNEDPCVREFGITVSEEFMKINARVLEPPALTYNGRSVVKPTQGAWRPNKFLFGVTLTQWTVINLDRSIRVELIEDMVKLMCAQSTSLGMTISQPQRPFQMLQLSYRKELQELEEAFKKKKDLQLIVVVVPNAGPLYSYVKQAAELLVGCLTQCVRNRTMFKMNVSTIVNILQKVNAKLEGINHILNDRMEWMRRPYMIMGADVTHPSPDSKDKPSVAAVTASYDTGAFKYNICWRLQPPKVEIIEELEDITREQLLYFYTSTKFKPERIIFFRDGVSEGQFQYVLNTEIQAIRRACTCLQPDGSYKPKITFLVVQKRHHTRFFPINPQDASKDKNLNVPVGTCVDTEITHPTALDFCLVSHASIQGVARPTKYRVLWDDADMSEDDLEQLTFYFCHMFSRCTRSVSYPAPTYYAHLAAARIMAYCETGKLNMNNLPQEQDRLSIKRNIIKGRPMFFV